MPSVLSPGRLSSPVKPAIVALSRQPITDTVSARGITL